MAEPSYLIHMLVLVTLLVVGLLLIVDGITEDLDAEQAKTPKHR